MALPKAGQQPRFMIFWSHPKIDCTNWKGEVMPKEDTVRSDGIAIRGTGPREAPSKQEGESKPPGKQPIPPRQRSSLPENS